MSHEITPAIKIYNVSRGLSETANCAHEFFRGHSHCEIPLHGVFSNADTDSINVHSYVKQMPQNIQIFLHANARKLFQRRHSNNIHFTTGCLLLYTNAVQNVFICKRHRTVRILAEVKRVY